MARIPESPPPGESIGHLPPIPYPPATTPPPPPPEGAPPPLDPPATPPPEPAAAPKPFDGPGQSSPPSPPSPDAVRGLQPDQAKSGPSSKLVPLVLVPILVVCAVVCLILFFRRKKLKVNMNSRKGMHDSESDGQHSNSDLDIVVAAAAPRRYHYRELAAATGDFAEAEKLGRGGFGSVYRGRLGLADDKYHDVAIKRFLSESSSQGRKEFEAEVKIISRLRHRNLVQLLGWCDSHKGLLLVYELVPGGSLDRHIYNSKRVLTWPERYKIILSLGSALHYLHQEWEKCIVHGDIKPSNIMVDSLYNTKLGDFGLARLIDHGAGWQTTKAVLGTAGYIDPELVNTRRPSTQSDMYSFGIVLLEIVSSRPPVVMQQDGAEPFVLLRWVWSLYVRNATLDAADERLRGDELYERQMERALAVGLWCAHPDLGQRPSVAQVMQVLQPDCVTMPALSPQMYMTSPPNVVVGAYCGGPGPGTGGSSSNLSSGVGPSDATGTTRSSSSFAS